MKYDQPENRRKIDADKVHALGVRFCGERNARNISTQDMADHLLLSKLQVVGLETGDLKSFYSAKMYAQSADKYAKFLGFEDKPSECIFESAAPCPEPVTVEEVETKEEVVIAPVTQPVEAETFVAPPKAAAALSRGSRFWVSLILLFAIGVVVALYTVVPTEPVTAAAPSKVTEVHPPAPTPAPTAAPEPAPVTPAPPPQPPALVVAQKTEPPKAESPTAEPVKAETVKPEPAVKQAAVGGVEAGHIRLKFTGSSWVQAVDKNGVKQEKVYKAGETLDLEPAKLQALVIGNSASVTVNDSKNEVSLKPYIASGSQVARIIGPDVRKLGE